MNKGTGDDKVMEGKVPRLNVDLDLSDEEEISCELELFSKDNEIGTDDKRSQSDGENGTVLDWSVSAISRASGSYVPDRFHTDFEPSSASASAWSSPEKVNRLQQPETSAAGEQESNRKTPDTVLKGHHNQRAIAQTETDIKQLVGNIQNLRNNIQSIYEKTVTPVNSPRHKKNVRRQNNARGSTSEEDDDAQSGNDPSVTPKAISRTSHSHYGIAFNTTPPVKDPGMKMSEQVHSNTESIKERNASNSTTSMAQSGYANNATKTSLNLESLKSTSSTVRLDQMRTVLRDLENARKKYSASKIPRRNLNFDSMPKKTEVEKERGTADSTKYSTTSSNKPEKANPSSVTYKRLVAHETTPSRKNEPDTILHEQKDYSDQQSMNKPFPNESKRLFEREFEEMDTYLNQVKNTPTPVASTLLLLESGRLSSEQSGPHLAIGSNRLGVENTTHESIESLRVALQKETKLRQELEAIVASLKKQVIGQTEQISLLEYQVLQHKMQIQQR